MGTASVTRNLWREQGVRGFYKGIPGPIIAQAAYKSVIFSTNSFVGRCLFPDNKTATTTFISGAIAGSVNAGVVAPVELIRTRQIMSGSSSGQAASFAATLQSCLREGIAGLWRGWLPAVARDGPGVGAYFMVYEVGKAALSRGDDAPTLGAKLLAGSCAGVAYWVVALPVDTLKAAIEAQAVDSLPGGRWAGGLRAQAALAARIVRERGFLSLYRAWPVAFSRGIPSAAVTLTTFDVVAAWLIRRDLRGQ